MISKNYISKAATLLIIIFLFFLPSFQKISVISLILLFLAFIFSGNIKGSFKAVFKEKILFLPVLFFILHLLSLVYSKNFSYGLNDLETKLSFFIFPFFLTGFNFDKSHFEKFKISFIAGVIFSSLISLVNSLTEYSKGNSIHVFFYEEYSYFLHPTYFTMLLGLTLIFNLETFFYGSNKPWFKFLNIIIIIFVFGNITLLTSRTGLTVTLLTVVLYFIYLFYKSNWTKALTLIKILTIVVLLIPQLFILRYYNRFNLVRSEMHIKKESNSQNSPVLPENTSRMALWKNAFELIRNNPVTGVGAGDIKDEFSKVNSRGITESYLNPHNQYLHTTVALGLTGLLVLLAMFFFPFLFAVRNDLPVYALFILIIVLNCFTESILERQAGILFFNFFNILFFVEKSLSFDKLLKS